jgi:hypothetical protein
MKLYYKKFKIIVNYTFLKVHDHLTYIYTAYKNDDIFLF